MMDDLEAYVWADLPPMKYLAGRALVARLTRRLVQRWPSGVMLEASDEGRGMVMGELVRSVERSERQNYRMGIVLTLILSALLSEVVKAILAWWLRSASNRTQLVGYQQEMAK